MDTFSAMNPIAVRKFWQQFQQIISREETVILWTDNSFCCTFHSSTFAAVSVKHSISSMCRHLCRWTTSNAKSANCHKKLHREAKYVKELELSEETELTEEDRALAADTNANNPYYDAPELPESLLGYVCDCNKTWSFSRSKGYFNLIDGVWVNR